MGTRGYIGYRYRNRHYYQYHSHDTYLSGKGREVVASIPTDPVKFARWLRKAKAFCTHVKDRTTQQKQWMEDVSVFVLLSDEILDWPDDEEGKEDDNGAAVSSYPPQKDVFIEWVYIMDLDFKRLIIDNKIHLKLDDIPRGSDDSEWFDFVACDSIGNKCRSPYMPLRYRAPISGHFIEPNTSLVSAYDDLHAVKIEPTTWGMERTPRLANARRLAMVAAEGFMSGAYGSLHYYHRVVKHIKVDLFEFFEVLLSSAAPLNGRFWSEPMHVGFCWHLPFHHRQDNMPFFFRFRECWVCLDYMLSNVTEDSTKHCVATVARQLQAQSINDATVIVCSCLHVMVVIVSEGKISHSDVYPLVAGYGTAEWKDGYQEALHLLTFFLRPSCIDTSASIQCRLPLDVILRVMECVDDDACAIFAFVSKAFRFEWAKYPRIASYRIIGPSQVDEGDGCGFLVKDENDERIEIVLSPIRCRSWNDYAEEKEETGVQVFRESFNAFRNDLAEMPYYLRVSPSSGHSEETDIEE